MTSRVKTRLERLEARVIPPGPPEVIEIVYVDADGERTPGPVIKLQAVATQDSDLGRRRRLDSYR